MTYMSNTWWIGLTSRSIICIENSVRHSLRLPEVQSFVYAPPRSSDPNNCGWFIGSVNRTCGTSGVAWVMAAPPFFVLVLVAAVL